MITWECKIGKEKVSPPTAAVSGLFSKLTQGADTTFTSHSKSPLSPDTASWQMDVSLGVETLEVHINIINSYSTMKDRYFSWIVFVLVLVKGCIIYTVASHPGQMQVVHTIHNLFISLYTTSWVIVLATYQHLPEPLISWLFCANGFLWPYPYRAP